MNRIYLLSLILFFPLIMNAQLTKSLDEEQIKLAMNIQEQNWNMGNIPGFMSSYWKSDSLLFIGSKGPTYGWSKTLANYLKAYPNSQAMGKLSFKNFKIEILDKKNAYVAGEWILERENDQLGGYYTLLWKKLDGIWKIVADHSSSK